MSKIMEAEDLLFRQDFPDKSPEPAGQCTWIHVGDLTDFMDPSYYFVRTFNVPVGSSCLRRLDMPFSGRPRDHVSADMDNIAFYVRHPEGAHFTPS